MNINKPAESTNILIMGLGGIGYYLAGMGMFDALCHAFSTVAIGGFSTHDASIAYFDSRAVNVIAMFFMFAAGINFSLHFLAWRGKTLKGYITDSEFRCTIFKKIYF